MKVSLGKRFTWRIENFSRLKTKKLYSEIFKVGGYKLRVLIFPKGNNVDHLSIYLDAADSATLPYIKFSLSVISHIHNKFTVKKVTQHHLNARESYWGFTSFMPLSELYGPGRGYLVNDTCIVEADFAGAIVERLARDPKKETGHVELEVEAGKKRKRLRVEAAKTASGKGETPKSSSQRDINGRVRQTAFGTNTVLPQTDSSGPPPVSKSATQVIKTLVPPTIPIVGKESTVSYPQAQYPEVELLRSSPMGSDLESSSFDGMDAYISKLMSVVETAAPFDSTTEGSVAASIPQSTIDEAKRFKMLSRDLLEIPDFAVHLTESISVLSECFDLAPAQLAELNTLKVEFPTLLKTYQTCNLSLKEVEAKMAEQLGTKKSLVEQVKINAFAFQMQRAIHKDLISKEVKLQQGVKLAKISEKKKSAEKVMKQLHGKMVNLEQSISSVLEEISTLETDKKTMESSLSSIQQKWTELIHYWFDLQE